MATKPHPTVSAMRTRTRNDSGTTRRLTSRPPTAFNKNARTQPPSSEAGLALASTSFRTHTLVLSGELHHRSAHTLESEIERLCEEGVTGITLDLRELEYIDSTGIAVIAFRCGLCKRRGYDFAVIPGSRFMHRALEQAGVSELLPLGG